MPLFSYRGMSMIFTSVVGKQSFWRCAMNLADRLRRWVRKKEQELRPAEKFADPPCKRIDDSSQLHTLLSLSPLLPDE